MRAFFYTNTTLSFDPTKSESLIKSMDDIFFWGEYVPFYAINILSFDPTNVGCTSCIITGFG